MDRKPTDSPKVLALLWFAHPDGPGDLPERAKKGAKTFGEVEDEAGRADDPVGQIPFEVQTALWTDLSSILRRLHKPVAPASVFVKGFEAIVDLDMSPFQYFDKLRKLLGDYTNLWDKYVFGRDDLGAREAKAPAHIHTVFLLEGLGVLLKAHLAGRAHVPSDVRCQCCGSYVVQNGNLKRRSCSDRHKSKHARMAAAERRKAERRKEELRLLNGSR